MEYVFLIFFAVLAGLYLADRKGWNATAKRLTNIVRANIEAGKPIKTLSPVKDQDDWEQQFKAIENPNDSLPAVPEQKHKIIKHTYTSGLGGDVWPQWVCKCGGKGSTPTGIWSDKETHEKTRREGQEHVQRMNQVEERIKNAKGKDFAW